jgi:hypothetical protein
VFAHCWVSNVWKTKLDNGAAALVWYFTEIRKREEAI